MATETDKKDAVVCNSQTVVDATVTASEATASECCPNDSPAIKKDFPSYKIPASTGWSKNWYSSNPGYLQSSHMTKEERFPLIFDSAKKLAPDAKRILSFGCSTGEECQSLGKRFPDSEVVGLDIDHYTIQTARKKNKSEKIFFTDEIGCTGKYDLVTALMVFFCMEEPIPKDRFIASLKKIDNHLNDGGILMIYTSDYDPKEILGDSYEDLNVWVREHNKNKKQYWNGYYRKNGGITYQAKLEIDPSTMPTND